MRIEDIAPFVREQHEALKRDGRAALITPAERVIGNRHESAWRRFQVVAGIF